MKVHLPPGCAGFADGDQKWMADKPGGHVNLDPADPEDARALRKLKNQDYASAGLVDAGPEKQFIADKRKTGRWCKSCNRIWHAWVQICGKCGQETISEVNLEAPPFPKDINGGIIP